MQKYFETQRGNLTISTDPARLDMDAVCDFLSRAYWAKGRSRAVTERAFAHSLVFGLYEGTRQIGLARVVSDFAIFAYLCDFFIHEDYRGRGVGQWMLKTIFEYPDLKTIRRWMLATSDAHTLYARYGFKSPGQPETWMEWLRPFPEEFGRG
ncbi:MAG: GNAT family N-acetyltransferase [Chloroflexota bacterium]